MAINIFSKLFAKKAKNSNYNLKAGNEIIEESEINLYIYKTAIITAIDLISRTLAKCRFQTLKNGKLVKSDEYYLWNIRPNKHQTKQEFFQQLVFNLIFDNEVLIVETYNKDLLIADRFSREQKAVVDDIFRNVTVRNLSLKGEFLEKDVLYINFTNNNFLNILEAMTNEFEKIINFSTAKYERSSENRGILTYDGIGTGTIAENESLRDFWKKTFKDFRNQKSGIMLLPNSYKYVDLTTNYKSANTEINDIEKMVNQIYTSVGNALHIPPALMLGTASMLKDSFDNFMGNCIDPLAEMLQQEIIHKRYGKKEYLNGNYIQIDTSYCSHIDPIQNAVNIDKSIACGTITPAQVQDRARMVASDDEFAKNYYMTKNYQTADLALQEGGENNV